jgi:hypothetical protein
MKSAGMIAHSAVNGHPDIDVDKVGIDTKQLYFDMMSAVPYFTEGTTSTDALQDEREAAAAEYKRIFVDPYKKKPGFKEEKLEQPTILKRQE